MAVLDLHQSKEVGHALPAEAPGSEGLGEEEERAGASEGALWGGGSARGKWRV